jgi:hypothetical protein
MSVRCSIIANVCSTLFMTCAAIHRGYVSAEAGREAQELWPTRSGGLRICGNPMRDVSHASNFGSALRCILPA